MSESRGYSSESRSRSSESRSESYRTQGGRFYSTESRGPSESRVDTSYEAWLRTDPWIARGGLSSAAEMRTAYNEWVREKKGSTGTVSRRSSSSPKKKYNSLDDVDKLIQKLEAEMPQIDSESPVINEALEAKKQKIGELKELVAKARAAERERQLLAQIKQDTDEIDKAMDSINRGFGK